MTNGYLTFLDYLELRRRVEKRLTSGKRLLTHTIIFGVMAFIVGMLGYSPIGYQFRNYYIRPTYGILLAVWSGVLFAHALWVYWRSGSRGERRDQVIESEIRARLENNDLYLSDQPHDLFRFHVLLNRDIQKRASMIPILGFFLLINVLMWIPWAINDARNPWAWMNTPILIFPLLLALLLNFLQRGLHAAKFRNQIEELFSNQATQSIDDYKVEREMRLSDDDDELVTVDEYMMKRKR